MHILILEDDALIAMLLAEWLAELGHDVAGPFATGREALSVIDGARIDAALLDLNLRDGDSYAVAARLRSGGIPFAFATGEGSGGVIKEFRDCPILQKPFDFDEVEKLFSGWETDVRPDAHDIRSGPCNP